MPEQPRPLKGVKKLKDRMGDLYVLLAAGAIAGALVAWAGLGQAQKDIREIKATDKSMAAAVAQIPVIQTDIEYIKDAILAIRSSQVRTEQAQKEAAIDDGKYHHRHP